MLLYLLTVVAAVAFGASLQGCGGVASALGLGVLLACRSRRRGRCALGALGLRRGGRARLAYAISNMQSSAQAEDADTTCAC
jgi:hypothetical protein